MATVGRNGCSGSLGCGRALLLLGALLHAASAVKVEWNVTGPYVNFPYGSPQPPFILRNAEGTAADRVVIVTDNTGSGWTLAAYEADTGKQAWSSAVSAPAGSNAGAGTLYSLTSGTPNSQQQNNTMGGTLFVQLGSYVIAVNAVDGSTLWQHPTYNESTPRITAYGDADHPGIVYLTSPFMDTTRPVPTPSNYIEALDAATGALKWSNFTAPPPNSGLAASDTAAAWGVTALPGMAVYAQGSRLYGLSADNGTQLWVMVVSAGSASGSASNVTSVTYLEPFLPARPHPVVLLGSATWEQTRYMAYQFNGTAGQQPTVLWQMGGNQNFEGSLEFGLARMGLALPQVSIYDNLFVSWSNRTSYDQFNGGRPKYDTFMVARSLDRGTPVWVVNLTFVGLSPVPVSPPTVQLGVLSFVTAAQMVVMDAGSGKMRYMVEAEPYQALAQGGQNSYVPTTTFANCLGQLAVVRCLDSTNPGMLCVYNGFDRPCTSAATRQRPALGSTLAGALLAAAAAAILL